MSLPLRLSQGVADVDEVVSDHAEPDPALHASIALVPGAVEPVPSLDDADAPLATGAPFLPFAEPALLLLALALEALGSAVGNADALDAELFGLRFVLGRVEGGVRRHQVRRAPELCLMGFDRPDQQISVARPLIEDLVVVPDLVFGF